MTELSFRTWLRAEVGAILERKGATTPLLFWCDPDLEWHELLIAAADGGAFELWAYDKHELVLREELRAAPAIPRVVWVPRRGCWRRMPLLECRTTRRPIGAGSFAKGRRVSAHANCWNVG